MNKPRVFVVQRPLRSIKDKKTGEVVDRIPMFDTAPAQRYGEVHILLEPGDVALMPYRSLMRLNEKLRDFTDNDYILPIGDPVLIGAAVAVAALRNNGKVRMLRWDRRDRCYTELEYIM